MIPSVEELLTTDLKIQEEADKTYQMVIVPKRIAGYSNEIKAVKQAIYKMLNTERYRYIIYSWNYGIELDDLIGQPVFYVVPEIERRITEALLQDNRILAVDTFEYEYPDKHSVHVTFTAHTKYGDTTEETEVTY